MPSSSTSRPAPTVFLDRDGVISEKPADGEYIDRWADFKFLPGAIQALHLLKRAGWRVVVITNQRGVALGHMTMRDVDEIHAQMQAELRRSVAECAAIVVCPHDEGSCECRKPRTGLFRLAVGMFTDIDPERAIVVGDSESDILFGNRIGCPTYLIANGRRRDDMVLADPDLAIDGAAGSLLDLVQVQLGITDDGGSRDFGRDRV
jgi:D-glycero-D-manno-heptose 1,7-bisphosphate phosphatase